MTSSETNLIGCLCLGARPGDLALDPRWLTSARAQAAWAAAVELEEWGHEVTTSTLLGAIPEAKKLNITWELLDEWSSKVASPAEAECWVEMVRTAYQKRRILQQAKRVEECWDGPIPPEILEGLTEAIEAQSHGSLKAHSHCAKDAVQVTFDRIETLSQRSTALTGIPSGLRDLDALTNGWQKSDLIILAARPSIGKSALAAQWMVHAAAQGHKVVMFSLEMAMTPVVMRLLASRSGVSGQRIQSGNLDPDHWKSLFGAADDLGRLPWEIVDQPKMTMGEIRAYTRKAKPDLAIVDYLQLIDDPDSRSNRERSVTKTGQGLKQLAREQGIPVIALSQLNRTVEDRMDHEPEMADLRESGGLEQDSDLITLIHRPDHYKKPADRDGKALLKVPKNRTGPTGQVEMTFETRTTTFRDHHGGEE